MTVSLLNARQILSEYVSTDGIYSRYNCPRFPRLGDELRIIREAFAVHIEQTLPCNINEELVVDEINQWFEDLKNAYPNSPVAESLHAFNSDRRYLYDALRDITSKELKLVEEKWEEIASAQLQKCSNLQQQSTTPATNSWDYMDETIDFDQFLHGMPRTHDATLQEQQLKQQVNLEVQALAIIVSWAWEVLLHYPTDFRLPYFSKPDGWGAQYQARLKSINQIRLFLQRFASESSNWRHVDEHSGPKQQIMQMLPKVDSAMTKLISQAMIITKQPQGTVRKDKNFDLEVKIFGHDFLPVKDLIIPPHIVVISDAQAEKLLEEGLTGNENIINSGCGTIEPAKQESTRSPFNIHSYNESEQSMTYQLNKYGIPTRPQDDSRLRAPLKQKFYMLFHTQLDFDGVGLPIRVWTLSAPFVYTTNASQDESAMATVFWDMYVLYKTPIDPTLSVSRTAQVWQIKAAFSRYISRETNITWSPSPGSLEFLVTKLLGFAHFEPTYPVNRSTIDESHDPDTNETFWKWFMGTIKLLNTELSEHWKEGRIIGYIDRGFSENLLTSQYGAGSCLVRFSSSQVGVLSFVINRSDGAISTTVPRNEKGQLVGGINKLICDSQDISAVVKYRLPGGDEYDVEDKVTAFSGSSAPNSPEQQHSGRNPYVKAFMMLSLRFNSFMRRSSSTTSFGPISPESYPPTNNHRNSVVEEQQHYYNDHFGVHNDVSRM